MKERTPFGERLYQARTYAKLTQTQLAAAAGVSQGTLGELEWRYDGSIAVVRLAMACGVRPEWLAEGEGDMVDPAAWPFELVTLEDVLSLKPVQRGFVEGRLVDAIEQARQMRRDILQMEERATPPVTAERFSPPEPEKVKGVSTPHPLKRETGLVEGSALATVVGRFEGKKKSASSKSGAVPKSRVGRRL